METKNCATALYKKVMAET
uniref:Uncharacterized protein n=1 Tax=Anguilla anguilla TaxID=7936 RepID=A0A0E9QPE1_ANGAN